MVCRTGADSPTPQWPEDHLRMNHSDFRVGARFYTATGAWLCTDIGARTIIATKLETTITTLRQETGRTVETTQTRVTFEEDPTWWNGPPYGVVERVFDEYAIEGCAPTPEVFTTAPPAS